VRQREREARRGRSRKLKEVLAEHAPEAVADLNEGGEVAASRFESSSTSRIAARSSASMSTRSR
jgi:hypothetical protein